MRGPYGGTCMQRRQFITLLSGTAVGWPLAVHANAPHTLTLLREELQSLGWSIGRNVRIDTRWATANAATIRRHAAELAAHAPDVILAHGASSVGPLLQATHTVPIVFPVVSDPVAGGFVDSLGRPGGNATGFMSFEYS